MQVQTLSAYQALVKPASRWMEIPILLGFNLLLVATSYICIYLPFSPVPITGQTFGVLVIAMALGRVRGTGVALAYVIEGALGLPVFAGGRAGIVTLMGPTGGYLIGFVVAAWVVGGLADRGWDRRYLLSLPAMLLGMIIIYIFGLGWLSRFVSTENLLAVGLYPFLPGAVIKVALASLVLPSVWRFLGTNRN